MCPPFVSVRSSIFLPIYYLLVDGSPFYIFNMLDAFVQHSLSLALNAHKFQVIITIGLAQFSRDSAETKENALPVTREYEKCLNG